MAWGWVLKRFAGVSRGTGLWSYLASKARDKSKIELEKTRTEATKQLLDHLPYGAVLREGTADGWREIRMPDAPQSPSLSFPWRAATREEEPLSQLRVGNRWRYLAKVANQISRKALTDCLLPVG